MAGTILMKTQVARVSLLAGALPSGGLATARAAP